MVKFQIMINIKTGKYVNGIGLGHKNHLILFKIKSLLCIV